MNQQQWQPGWYPDPQGGPRRRYWDGQQWGHYEPAPQPPKNPLKTAAIVGAVILGVIVLAVAGSSSEEGDEEPAKTEEAKSEDTSGAEDKDTEPAEDTEEAKQEEEDCTFKATDDCTPHVGPDGKVRVDALIWRLVSMKTADTLGDLEYGLGEKANGTFVVVKLKVTSTKTESVTLSDDVVGLEVKGGNTYKPDTDGTVAAIGAGEEPFFLEEVGPETTLTGTVVFDVPKKALNKNPELSFGELGFGSTKAYIKLPSGGT